MGTEGGDLCRSDRIHRWAPFLALLARIGPNGRRMRRKPVARTSSGIGEADGQIYNRYKSVQVLDRI
jgi:hypothetical protein